MSIVVVLNDESTFAPIEACFALEVPDDWDTDTIETALSNETVNFTDDFEKIPHGAFTTEQIKCVEKEVEDD